jgi:hypothetical protein
MLKEPPLPLSSEGALEHEFQWEGDADCSGSTVVDRYFERNIRGGLNVNFRDGQGDHLGTNFRRTYLINLARSHQSTIMLST